jgi:hypothetical protein
LTKIRVSVEPVAIPTKIVSLIVVLLLGLVGLDCDVCLAGQHFGTLFRHASSLRSLPCAVLTIPIAVVLAPVLGLLVPLTGRP